MLKLHFFVLINVKSHYNMNNELNVENLLRFIKSQKSHYSTMSGINGYEKVRAFHECLTILMNDIDALFIKPRNNDSIERKS